MKSHFGSGPLTGEANWSPFPSFWGGAASVFRWCSQTVDNVIQTCCHCIINSTSAWTKSAHLIQWYQVLDWCCREGLRARLCVVRCDVCILGRKLMVNSLKVMRFTCFRFLLLSHLDQPCLFFICLKVLRITHGVWVSVFVRVGWFPRCDP